MIRGDARHPGEGIQAGAAGQPKEEPLGGVAGGVCDEQWAAGGGVAEGEVAGVAGGSLPVPGDGDGADLCGGAECAGAVGGGANGNGFAGVVIVNDINPTILAEITGGSVNVSGNVLVNASGASIPSLDALIAGVQQKFPDFTFKLIGEPNGFGDHVRFSWGLGPDGVDSPIKGTDFALLKDGRIRSITGFLDQVPGA